jgi:hypothetical protein
MNAKGDGAMKESAQAVAESKYFLLWVAVWIAALAVLIPSLR